MPPRTAPVPRLLRSQSAGVRRERALRAPPLGSSPLKQEPPASLRSPVAAALTAVAATALLLLAWKVAFWLLIGFAAVLVAVALDGLRRIAGHATGWWGPWALTASTAVLVIVIGGVVWLAAGRVSAEATLLSEKLPLAWQTVEPMVASTGAGRAMLEHARGSDWGELLVPDRSALTRVAGRALGYGQTLVTLLAAAAVALVAGFYLAASPGLYVRGLTRLAPARHRGRLLDLLNACGVTLRRWLLGQMASMAILGALTTLGLWWLGIPLFLVLGLSTALLCFIPNLGPVLSVLPPLVLALAEPDGESLALKVAALYIAVQLFETNVCTPLIQKKAVRMPPALLLLGQVIAAAVLGLLGTVLAAPLLAVVLTAFQELQAEEG